MTAYKRQRLHRHLVSELPHYSSAHHMAKKNRWSYGLVYHVLGGGHSPTLYAQIFPPRQRVRAIINLTPTQLERWREMVAASGESAGDLLVDLMDLKDGMGEVV